MHMLYRWNGVHAILWLWFLKGKKEITSGGSVEIFNLFAKVNIVSYQFIKLTSIFFNTDYTFLFKSQIKQLLSGFFAWFCLNNLFELQRSWKYLKLKSLQIEVHVKIIQIHEKFIWNLVKKSFKSKKIIQFTPYVRNTPITFGISSIKMLIKCKLSAIILY